jgi:hypothetical protein
MSWISVGAIDQTTTDCWIVTDCCRRRVLLFRQCVQPRIAVMAFTIMAITVDQTQSFVRLDPGVAMAVLPLLSISLVVEPVDHADCLLGLVVDDHGGVLTTAQRLLS